MTNEDYQREYLNREVRLRIAEGLADIFWYGTINSINLETAGDHPEIIIILRGKGLRRFAIDVEYFQDRVTLL